MMQRILLGEPQADVLADILEGAIEDAHAETVEFAENTEERIDADDRLAVAILPELDRLRQENQALLARLDAAGIK